ERFPMPMTAASLASYDSGPALVAYLGQPDASPAVCDLRARGPHVSGFPEEMRASLVSGLVDGRIAAELWRRCAGVVLRGAPRDDASSLLDDIGRGYRRLIKSGDFEKSPALEERLAAMQRLYLERQNGVDGHAGVLPPLFADLRQALVKHRLRPAATRAGEELIATVDLEHGRWLGRDVDAAAIDGLFASGDEKTLRLFSNRLPTPELRDESKRRVIRLHIAASPFPEVREHAAAVEDALMKTGTNTISVAEHRPLAGAVDAAKLPMRGVLVRQDVWRQTATLLGYAGDRPGLSVLPEVKLRGALSVTVDGISRPVGLCAPPKELDPSPCIAPHDVTLENPTAYL